MALSIGDIHNNFEKLKQDLRSIKYPHQLTLDQVQEGLPPLFLPIIHHALLEFSPLVASHIQEKGFDLFAKNDCRFMESVYKLLLTHFSYKPAITVQ